MAAAARQVWTHGTHAGKSLVEFGVVTAAAVAHGAAAVGVSEMGEQGGCGDDRGRQQHSEGQEYPGPAATGGPSLVCFRVQRAGLRGVDEGRVRQAAARASA
jgi:hypothetical protein